jgi:zinc transporter ZupT
MRTPSHWRLAITNTSAAEATLRRLAPRKDVCAGSVVGADEYNLSLHVGALFIIFAVSGLACAVPMLASKFPFMRIPEPFFFGVRHFGTGVLLATAFVHLLPTAFISLGDPCLSSFWTTDYPAMPGAIALVGIFFVSVIEMVFSPARNFYASDEQTEEPGTAELSRVRSQPIRSSMTGGHCNNAAVVAAVTRPAHTRRPSVVEPAPLRETADQSKQPSTSKETLETESQSSGLTEEQLHKKSILQCMLLEVGILFHSVFIGMALSVAIGSNFVVLLIAIAFHRELALTSLNHFGLAV